MKQQHSGIAKPEDTKRLQKLYPAKNRTPRSCSGGVTEFD